MARAQESYYPWLLHTVIDWIFCLGGLLWLLFFLHLAFDLSGSNLSVSAIMVSLGTLMLGDTHTAATLVRLYGNSETREKLWFHAYGSAAIFALLIVPCFIFPALVGILCRLYLIFIVQHVTAQTYGIALVYCFKRGYALRQTEKNMIWWLLQITTVYAVLRQFTDPAVMRDSFLGIPLPNWGSAPGWLLPLAQMVLFGAVLSFVFVFARKAIRERMPFPLPPLFLVLTTIAIFSLGKELFGIMWLYAPAFFHGSQYLVVTTAYYLKENRLPEGIAPTAISSALLKGVTLEYWGMLLLIGIIVYLVLPQGFTYLGLQYTLTFATIFCCINLHHFLADNALWRMREAKVRQILLA